MKTKKMVALLLAIMMLTLAACGKSDKAEESTETIAVETVATTEEPTVVETEATTEATEATTEATEATEPEPNATIVNVNSYVNVRAEASISSEKVGTYAKGDRVYIETIETSGGVRWGKTELGWVCMDYVAVDGESVPETAASTEATTEATKEPTSYVEVEPPVTEATEATTAPTEAPAETTEPATTAPTEAATEATDASVETENA